MVVEREHFIGRRRAAGIQLKLCVGEMFGHVYFSIRAATRYVWAVLLPIMPGGLIGRLTDSLSPNRPRYYHPSKKIFQPPRQARARRFAQVDDLLPRQRQMRGQFQVIQRQSLPERGQLLGGHFQGSSDLS